MITGAAPNVSGKGANGKGGTVTIIVQGPFSFGSHNIKADGTTGGGGTIYIECHANLELNSQKVSAKAGMNSGGDGGNISVLIKKGLSTGALTLTGSFDVSGDGKGQGGNLYFLGESGITVSGPNTKFLANGGKLNGKGGKIFFQSSKEIPVELANFEPNSLSAMGGGDSGLGGIVEIPFAHGPIGEIDPLELIRVDGGKKLAFGMFDGGININDIKMNQLRLSNDKWPHSYWYEEEKVRLSSRRVLDLQASTLHINIRSLLARKHWELFTFRDGDGAAKFFQIEPFKSDLGRTYQPDTPSDLHRYVSINDQRFVNDEFDTKILLESSAHELGHAIDFSLAQPAYSPSYEALVLSDFLTLDYSDVRTPTKRLPCGSGSPFNFVWQVLTRQEFCPQPRLNILNSSFLRANSFRHRKDPEIGWAEVYAAAVAYHQYAISQNHRETADTPSNGVFANGYFSNTSRYARQLLLGNLYPAISPRQIPAWYLRMLKNEGTV